MSQWHSLLNSNDMTCMETELVDTKVLVEEAEENKKSLKIVTAGLLSKYTHTQKSISQQTKRVIYDKSKIMYRKLSERKT